MLEYNFKVFGVHQSTSGARVSWVYTPGWGLSWHQMWKYGLRISVIPTIFQSLQSSVYPGCQGIVRGALDDVRFDESTILSNVTFELIFDFQK